MKKFNALNISSKFAICGLPIRVDTYKTCSFGCKYCFSNNRKIMEFKKNLQIGDMEQVERKLNKIFNKKEIDKNNLLDILINQKITWHCGGMSDPFQPIIPNVATLKIIEMFKDADNFTLEGIKIVPQNKEHKEFVLKELGLKKEDFIQMGLLNLKPEIRMELYKPFIEYFLKNNISYSIADNDLHYLGTNKCCCGDELINKSTNFNNTAMIKKYGKEYTINDINNELGDCANCKCNYLFTSNRQEGCITVKEFYDKRFYRKTSPFSPKFQYIQDKQMTIFDIKEDE